MYFEGDPYKLPIAFCKLAGRTELLIAKLLPPTPEMEPKSKIGGVRRRAGMLAKSVLPAK